jgi:hypothetical protein
VGFFFLCLFQFGGVNSGFIFTLCAPFEVFIPLQRNPKRKASVHSFEWVDYICETSKNNKMENKYNMALIQPTSNTVYPNTEAHAELKAMNNRYKSAQKKYQHSFTKQSDLC